MFHAKSEASAAQSDGHASFSSLRMRATTEGLRKAAATTASTSTTATTTSPAAASFALGSSGDSAKSNIGWPFGKQQAWLAQDELRPRGATCFAQIDVPQQVAEWDTEMDSLDKKQEQLLNEQWRLLRTQIASMMGALEEMRSEVSGIKETAVMKSCWPDVEQVIEDMMTAHDDHGKKNEQLTQRVAFLEEFIGESFEKHGKALEEDKAAHHAHKTTMETRLEFLEGMIGDSSNKHAKEIEAANDQMQNLQKAIADCVQREHQSTMEQRMDYLEKFLGESKDKHDRELANHKQSYAEHSTSMETRLEYLEGAIGDSADKHAKEIAAAKDKMGDLHQAILSCATSDNHANVEQRLGSLEKSLRDSSYAQEQEVRETKNLYFRLQTTLETQLAESKTLNLGLKYSTETRLAETQNSLIGLKSVTDLLGGSAEQNAKEIEALKAKVIGCDKSGSSLDQRVDYMEQFLGESAEKHAKELAALESFIGDSADRHAKEVAEFRATTGDLDDAIRECVKGQQHSGLEIRVEDMEKKVFAVDSITMEEPIMVARDEFQRALKTVWEALDTHTHDVDVGAMQQTAPVQFRQVSRGVTPPPARVTLQTVQPSMVVTNMTPPASPALTATRVPLRTSFQQFPAVRGRSRSVSPAPAWALSEQVISSSTSVLNGGSLPNMAPRAITTATAKFPAESCTVLHGPPRGAAVLMEEVVTQNGTLGGSSMFSGSQRVSISNIVSPADTNFPASLPASAPRTPNLVSRPFTMTR